MIVEIDAAILPAPIVIDTDAPPSSYAGIMHPSVKVRLSPGSAPLATWSPAGDPEAYRTISLVALALTALVITFAVVGLSKSL